MIIFSVYTSLIFFGLAIFWQRKNTFNFFTSLLFFCLALLMAGFNLFYGISDYFTGNGITDAVLYHLNYGLDGAGFKEYTNLFYYFAATIFFTLSVCVWASWKTFTNEKKQKRYVLGAFFSLILAIFLNPAIPDLYKLKVAKAETEENIIVLNEEVSSMPANIAEMVSTTPKELPRDFATLYEQPFWKKIGENKNLVFIYLEGFEYTYSNNDVFPGLTKGLSELQKKSLYFTNLEQVYGTGYTIAGMVGSQCGIPLVAPSHGNSMSGMDSYLPLATCLGDLLKREGYYLSYYGGADLDFAGKGIFYRTHGFDEVNGLNELLPKVSSSSYKNNWGLYDDSLFNLALEKYLDLSQNKEKFGLFMLTLGTHHPNGHPAETCRNIIYQDGKNKMLNSVACSDYLVFDFINKILQSPYAAKTVIVVASDHLGLRNGATEFLDTVRRTDRFMIISPEISESREVNTLGSVLDIGSTLLPFIGFNTEIGLGRNLLRDNLSTDEIIFIHKNLPNWKKELARFWSFPKITDGLLIDTVEKNVFIEGRKFKAPVLIELDENLQTTLKFRFYVLADYDLVTQVNNMKVFKPFILVDDCKNIKTQVKEAPGSGLCLLSKKNKQYSVQSLSGKIFFTNEEVRAVAGLVSGS